jgi:hypothetical protein
MPALMGVLGGVMIRRGVATESDAAGLTSPQMNPVVADFHAFFAFAALRRFDRCDRGDVETGRHMSVPLFAQHLMDRGNTLGSDKKARTYLLGLKRGLGLWCADFRHRRFFFSPGEESLNHIKGHWN